MFLITTQAMCSPKCLILVVIKKMKDVKEPRVEENNHARRKFKKAVVMAELFVVENVEQNL
jgi:hypothetical protein